MPVIITASFVYSVYILSRSASSLGQTEIIQAKKLVLTFKCNKTCND